MNAMRKIFCSLAICLSANVVQAANVTVVISGLGGSEEYTEKFNEYATTIADEARRIALTPTDVMLLRGDASKKEILTALFEAIATREDINRFTAFFIGHGSFDGKAYKFNIPGPDITGEELTDMLNSIKSKKQLVVAATSASGALLDLIDTGNNVVGQRVLITATKNGREKTAVLFPEYLVEALTNPAADTNKDESISAAEIFEYANTSIATYYETEKLLAPEHARLQGEQAANYEITRYGNLLASQNAIPQELAVEKETLANQISILRSRKDDIDEDEYFDTLQNLMLKLAEIQKQIDTESNQSGN